MACAPQRYCANNRNELLAATLTPSSVLPVTDQVLQTQLPRDGTAQVALTGSYNGTEEATYDVEIVNDTATVPLISAPVFTGEGSGALEDITATGLPAQEITVELAEPAVRELSASVDFEGVTVKARAPGVNGNLIHVSVDQSALVYTATNYSTLEDLAAGGGDETTALKGEGLDWDTCVLGADNVIPDSSTDNALGANRAHRLIFEHDKSVVYLQFKYFQNGDWFYRFVPALKRDIPKGTRVFFVTGGRTVTVTDGASPESYPNIVTLYDILDAFKSQSALVTVDGVVANDRTPDGQAARDLQLRTDARVGPSTGSGSAAATGMVDTFANSSAATELVTARCFAVTGADNPLASVGFERWEVKGSVSGALPDAVTGNPYVDPSDKFGFTIPRKLPAGFGGKRGRFDVTDIFYEPRAVNVDPPPICVVSKRLGTQAVDQTITLRWTKRPSGDCLCDKLPKPFIGGFCLGLTNEGGSEDMSYQSDTVARLADLRSWFAGVVRDNSSSILPGEARFLYGTSFPIFSTSTPAPYEPQSLHAIVNYFETIIALIDPLPAGSPDFRGDGMTAWDAAVVEIKADIALIAAAADGNLTATADEALAAGDALEVYKTPGTVLRVRKFSAASRLPFAVGTVADAVLANGIAQVHTFGKVTNQTGLTIGFSYYGDPASPGDWTVTPPTSPALRAVAISTTEMLLVDPATGSFPSPNTVDGYGQIYAIASDRYVSRIEAAAAAAGLSLLGKTDASIIESGDGCWRDFGGDYWAVTGSVGGAYAPCFNNEKYYSSRRADEEGAYFSTREFGFQVNMQCPGDLIYGDEIHLAIGDAAWSATYQVGDVLTLPVISARDLYLAGGRDGNEIERWYVNGSVFGAFPPFLYDGSSPTGYNQDGLAFDIVPGGIPFAKGDGWRFSIEGGNYRWRKNAGSWSAPINIPAAPAALDSGLSITFTNGAAPSFVAGDLFTFTASQPWAASNMLLPDLEAWAWADAGSPDLTTVVFDCGGVKSFEAFLIAFHTLPAGTTLLLEGGTSPGVYTWSEPLTWRAGAIYDEFVAAQSARYLRLSLTDSGAAAIGWVWGGIPFSTTRTADIDLRRAYKLNRPQTSGINQRGLFLGKTISGQVEYTEGSLTEADAVGLQAMLDHVKENDDEPFAFLPQVTRPDEVLIASVLADEVEFGDVYRYGLNASVTSGRKFSAVLPLQGVWQ